MAKKSSIPSRLLVAAFFISTIALLAYLYVESTKNWSKIFGGLGDDVGYSVQQTADGGYVLTGATSRYAVDPDVIIIKTDRMGVPEWEMTFGGEGYDVGRSVWQTVDGGYVIAGITDAGDRIRRVLLIKTDTEGNQLWNRTFGGLFGYQGFSVVQTHDGGYAIGGEEETSNCGNSHALLLKTDPIGELEWKARFGGAGEDRCYSVQQTRDGGYVLAGRSNSQGHWDVLLVKASADGNLVWERNFGGQALDIGFCCGETEDGGYIVVGRRYLTPGDSDVYLVRTDPEGSLVWERTYGVGRANYGYSVQQTKDHGFVVTGFTMKGSSSASRDIYLLKTDQQGSIVWEKSLGGPNSDIGYYVQETDDGGYVIVGRTVFDYRTDDGDIILVKVHE